MAQGKLAKLELPLAPCLAGGRVLPATPTPPHPPLLSHGLRPFWPRGWLALAGKECGVDN